jgi:hypothetical protein
MDMLDAYHCDQEAALDIDDAGPLDDLSEDEEDDEDEGD